jgi:hypothetical protein
VERISKIILMLSALVLLAGPAPLPAFAQEASPGQQLAERYSPVAYVRYHERKCGTPPNDGEPYTPLPVELVLNNDEVLVRDGSKDDAVVAVGPGAQELATFGPETYLDFPGDPRQPGCTYETGERTRAEEADLKPSVYAHIIFDEENQRLALQYWFYWYFNDWNNTHESDWEGIQVMWDEVSGVEEALTIPPDRIGYSQHGNGELADWGDDKVKLDNGTHPRVYPAAGSHASFFSNDTFLAWGERNSGFGCDIAAPASVRTPLDVILIPDEIDPRGEFAWLLYEGRWGERQPGAFNGPRGPMLNSRWADPWVAADTWRPFGIVVPRSNTLGPSTTEWFCSVTEAGARLMLSAIINPFLIWPPVILIAGAFLYFTRKSWPIFRRAVALYRAHWRLFIGIGLVSLPIGILFNVLQRFFIDRQPLKFVVNWLNNTGGAELTAVMSVGGLQQLAMVLIISPAIVFAISRVLDGQPTRVRDAFKGGALHMSVITFTFVTFLAASGVLLLTAIGFPIAIWLAVRWHFFLQAVVMDDVDTPHGAFRQSARVVRGNWISSFFALAVFDTLAVLPGVVVGFGLLTIGRTAVGFANGISSLLYALLIPLSVICVTLLYIERRDHAKATAEEERQPAPVSKKIPTVAEGRA